MDAISKAAMKGCFERGRERERDEIMREVLLGWIAYPGWI
jgi:hypothetical protein